MIEDKKAQIFKVLDQFKKAIIEDKYDFYKYFIADLFDELANLKAEQIEKEKSK